MSLKISIITVCKNAESTIERTILSVINQTYADVEYIIVDGESTDKTLDIVNKYNDKISLILSEKDNGIFDAMNKAIDLASGDFINFMNADDFFDSDIVLEKVASAIKKNPDCDFLFGDYRYFKGLHKTNVERTYQYLFSNPYFFMIQNLNHQSIFYKKEVFEKFGKYEGDKYKITADTYYNMNLVLKSDINVCYLPMFIANYSASGFSAKNLKLFAKEKKRILRKFYGLGFSCRIFRVIAYLCSENLFLPRLRRNTNIRQIFS